jgi:hypothetical protein
VRVGQDLEEIARLPEWVVPTVIVVISLYEYVGVRNRLKCP